MSTFHFRQISLHFLRLLKSSSKYSRFSTWSDFLNHFNSTSISRKIFLLTVFICRFEKSNSKLLVLVRFKLDLELLILITHRCYKIRPSSSVLNFLRTFFQRRKVKKRLRVTVSTWRSWTSSFSSFWIGHLRSQNIDLFSKHKMVFLVSFLKSDERQRN